jgi:hypothetical protein
MINAIVELGADMDVMTRGKAWESEGGRNFQGQSGKGRTWVSVSIDSGVKQGGGHDEWAGKEFGQWSGITERWQGVEVDAIVHLMAA